MRNPPWSESEIDFIVKDYFDMLLKEVRGEKFVKARHWEALIPVLNGRKRSSIEMKHMNISSVLDENSLKYINGYKPYSNKQKLLISAVLKHVKDNDLQDLLQVSTEKLRDYPIGVYSWEVLNANVAIKNIDKSCIEHDGTGVPQEILFFFDAEDLSETKNIKLIFRGESIAAQLKITNSRLRMFWPKRFSRSLEKHLPDDRKPDEYGLGMRLSKLNGNATEFDVQLIEEIRVIDDAQDSDDHPHQGSTEGRKRSYYGTRYERDPKNRKRALEIHGYVCKACGFDFGNVYGERGLGYIEVHHTKPLGEESSEIYVDPQKDLIPLCANCHRIVHRFRDQVLSLDELKKLIQ